MSHDGEEQYEEDYQDGEEYDDMEGIDPENMDEEQLRAYYAMHHMNQGEEYEEDGEEQYDYGDEEEQLEGGESQYLGQSQNNNENHEESQQKHHHHYEGESPRSQASIDNSFTSDPDQMRIVRRDLLENLNKVRREKKIGHLYIDLMTNQIAHDYAQYLNLNPPDMSFYKQLLEQHRNDGECHLTFIVARYEEDSNVTKELTYNYFMEMGYLFLEVETDRKFLLDPQMNHIGLGVAANESHVVIVQILSRKVLAINKVIDAPNQSGIIVQGRMLDDKVGIYALRLSFFDTKNEIHKIGPEMIDLDRQSKEFNAFIETTENVSNLNRKHIELYVRNNPDSIAYKKQNRDKLNLKHVDLIMRIPVFQYPDPRYAQEDELARVRKYEDEQREAKEEEEKKKTQENVKRKRGDRGDRQGDSAGEDGSQRSLLSDERYDQKSQEGFDDEEKKEEVHIPQKKFEIPKEQQISNKEIREELEIAIAEAQRQHDELYDHNLQLQQKIKMLRNRQEVYVDKTGEMAMNEHKYLNTLAHVHQIRLDLKQTQDRYNKMAYELQTKLEEKQKKCNEIKLAFMELKREVARKAAFSRTDKPIPEKQIDDWEQREVDKNRDLQELRLDLLRLRNTLAKNQKILKKKEELAEGLHLIDFEQLKIENQTLNEKIEERNEDLHKLKNKNTKTVQILTHTKEKLGFVKTKFEDLQKINNVKDTELNQLRENLSDMKKTKDKLGASNLRLKQQTGIVNSQELIQDFHTRKQKIVKLKNDKQTLLQQLEHMHQVINQYNQVLKVQQTMGSKVKQF